MSVMFSLVAREDQNVIQINDHKLIKILTKDIIHQVLEDCRGVRETKGHNNILEMTISSTECCFPFVTWPDPDKIVSTPEINLREFSSEAEPVEKVVYQWQRIAVLDRE